VQHYSITREDHPRLSLKGKNNHKNSRGEHLPTKADQREGEMCVKSISESANIVANFSQTDRMLNGARKPAVASAAQLP
jgi:hypothetical protein